MFATRILWAPMWPRLTCSWERSGSSSAAHAVKSETTVGESSTSLRFAPAVNGTMTRSVPVVPSARHCSSPRLLSVLKYDRMPSRSLIELTLSRCVARPSTSSTRLSVMISRTHFRVPTGSLTKPLTVACILPTRSTLRREPLATTSLMFGCSSVTSNSACGLCGEGGLQHDVAPLSSHQRTPLLLFRNCTSLMLGRSVTPPSSVGVYSLPSRAYSYVVPLSVSSRYSPPARAGRTPQRSSIVTISTPTFAVSNRRSEKADIASAAVASFVESHAAHEVAADDITSPAVDV